LVVAAFPKSPSGANVRKELEGSSLEEKVGTGSSYSFKSSSGADLHSGSWIEGKNGKGLSSPCESSSGTNALKERDEERVKGKDGKGLSSSSALLKSSIDDDRGT
jgi:hypothetical protein